MDLDVLELLMSGPFGWLVALLWGAIWGSFFNVVVARVPEGLSVVRPGSHCFSCGAPIAWYDNVPLLSYLWLRGRCRRCGATYSARYLLVEGLVCALSLVVFSALVVGEPGPLGLRLARFVIASLFCGVLVAVTFIDLRTLRIPDAITYPAIPICMGLSPLMEQVHWWDGLAGGVAGYLLIRLIADGYQLLTGRQGMGYGDAKLLAMIGGLLGWQALLPALFLASLQGSVIGITALVLLRRRNPTEEPEPPATHAGAETDAETNAETAAETNAETAAETEAAPEPASLRHARIPFGPFLSLAAVEVLLLRDLVAGYLPFLW